MWYVHAVNKSWFRQAGFLGIPALFLAPVLAAAGCVGPADSASLMADPDAGGSHPETDSGNGTTPPHDGSPAKPDGHVSQPLLDAQTPDDVQVPDGSSDQDDDAQADDAQADDAKVDDAKPDDAPAAETHDGSTACINDLSNIKTADFHVSFRLTTSQAGWVALANQRSVCKLGAFWEIRVCSPGHDDCPVAGGLMVETGGSNASSQYNSLYSTTALADGQPHEITVARVAGALKITIDGRASGSGESKASFGALPPLLVGTDACIGYTGDPTVALAAGSLSNLCITSP